MSIREFMIAVEGYNERWSREWEHTRAVMYIIAAANRDPKKPFPTIENFIPLPSDKSEDDKMNDAKHLKDLIRKTLSENRLNA